MYGLSGRTGQPLGAAAPQGPAIQHRGRKPRRRRGLCRDNAVIPKVAFIRRAPPFSPQEDGSL